MPEEIATTQDTIQTDPYLESVKAFHLEMPPYRNFDLSIKTIAKKVYQNLSERARENLKEEIEILGPQLAKNVYAAQRKIVDAVRTLEEAGEIVIGGGGAEYEVIQ